MAKAKTILTLPALILLGSALQAQDAGSTRELPLLSFGIGISNFKGDVGKDAGGFQTGLRTGFRFGAEQRFLPFLGAGIHSYYGSLSAAERSPVLHRNFESKIIQAGADAIFYFDNDFILPRTASAAPWISIGFSWFKFDPYGDLKNKNNITYQYWSDGTIRDLPESPANEPLSTILQRDYTYETQLKDSLNNYTRSSFAVPVGAGFRFSFGHNLSADIGLRYNISFTDYIDNVKDGGNDSWMTLHTAINFKFGKEKQAASEKERYTSVDYKSIDNQDYDGDGVIDDKDQCPGTPAGVKVDGKGCPPDGDNDGVPDYMDREPNTPKGLVVNEYGESIEAGSTIHDKDSTAGALRKSFDENPNRETLARISDQASQQKRNSKLPEMFQPADLDHDDFITADEITRTIDRFFDGEGDWTAEKINRLIDFFFDQ